MKVKSKLITLISPGVLAFSAGYPLSAMAQTSLVMEEVLVSARKRDESLQDVPIAISAFTSEEIQNAGIRDVLDVATLTPGFNMAPLFGGDAQTPVIRGLSTTIGEANVGFFIDGVYTGSRLTMNRLLGSFVDRIEVAKGPQSALYGRNTFGGAVNFVTRRPGEEFEGEIEATVGNVGKQEIRATFGGPIGDSGFGFRVGLLHDESDGFYNNTLTGGNLDTRETQGALGALSWTSNNFTADFNLLFDKVDNGDLPLRYIENNSFFNSAFGLPPGNQMYVGVLPSPEQDFSVTPGGLERDQVFSSLSLDWDLGAFSLTSITGYNDFTFQRDQDDDFSARDIHYLNVDNDVTEWSQELRLTSNGTGPLEWMVGLYYYELDDQNDSTRAYTDIYRPLFGGTRTRTHLTTEDLAIFGSLGWSITDTLTLDISGRYGTEKKDVVATDTDVLSEIGATFRADDSWSSFQPRVSLDWQLNEDHMAYVSFAMAEKSGGFNVVTTTGAILPSERFYQPETSDNYEIGLKSGFADGRILTTLAAYLIKWDDQIVRAIGESGSLLNTNVGASTSQGVEFEIQGQLTESLSLRAGAAYNDTQYDDYFFAILGGLGLDPVLDGTTLQYTPEWTGNISLDYRTPLSSGLDFVARVDANYIDEQTAVQTGDALIESVSLLNLRAGVSSEQWDLLLWAYNITDEQYTTSAAFTGDPTEIPDVILLGEGYSAFQAVTVGGDQRSYGLTARYRF